jgi:hypothetical protein
VTSKKKVSEVERGMGFLMGLVRALMGVASVKNVPFEALHRLATPSGHATLEKVVELTHAEWLGQSGLLERITVPNVSAVQLIRLAQSKFRFTYLSPELGERWFVTDEAGKTYEAMSWKPGRSVSSDEVRKHFPVGFKGNTAAFVAMVTEKNLMGWHFSILEYDMCFPSDQGLHPFFVCNGANLELNLHFDNGEWSSEIVFWAFRPINE